MCYLRDSDFFFWWGRGVVKAAQTFSLTNLFTKTFLHTPRTCKIQQTTMVGACTKKETQKAKQRKLYTNRDDTGIQGLSPK